MQYEFALFYGTGVNVSSNCICISIIVSVGLRLLSLANNSEEAGLYLKAK
jgi:hypothetical protein